MRNLLPAKGQLHVGIDLGGTKLMIVSISAQHQQVSKFPTNPQTTPFDLNHLIRATVKQHLRHSSTKRVAAMGLAVPGLVDQTGKVELCDVLPKIQGWRPADDLPDLSPGAVGNDGESALLELAASAPPSATLAAIGCGTGIALAFQLAGLSLRSVRPFAGELGFAPFGASTFDQQASGSSLLKTVGMNGEDLAEALQKGDARCLAATQASGRAFGASLATVVNLLHPEQIGLYGGVLQYEAYLASALEELRKLALPVLLDSCEVGLMPSGPLAVAHGALRRALQQKSPATSALIQ